jgi:hypothetical protein
LVRWRRISRARTAVEGPVVVAVLADVDHAELIARIEVDPGDDQATGANSHRVMDGERLASSERQHAAAPVIPAKSMISLDFERPDAAPASKCCMLVRASRRSIAHDRGRPYLD